jgi:hypothetical protein
MMMVAIQWQRRRKGSHFGAGDWHDYRVSRWSDGWVLSQTRGGVWHMQPQIYRTLRDAKSAACQQEQARAEP